MIKECDFNEIQIDLYNTMSEISEDCYYARWMGGLEFSLWEAMQTGNLRYGADEINLNKLNKCKQLSKALDGWIIWVDDELDKSLQIEEWGARFVSMTEWLVMFEKHKIKDKLCTTT